MSVRVELEWLSAGYCWAVERLTIRDGRIKWCRLPAGFGLIRHPQRGPVLFDTGYALRFYEVTRCWPYRLYALVTPVEVSPADTALAQLAARGIKGEDVAAVVVSHFHGDHVGGLRDFPRADMICSRAAYAAVRPLSGLAAVRQGYLPALLPEDFEQRVRAAEEQEFVPLSEAEAPFSRGYDVFGDGSCRLVQLPGHAIGQVGMLVETVSGTVLLAADACWHSRSYRQGVDLHPLAHLLLTANRGDFQRSLSLLMGYHRLHPQVPIYPSHCPEALEQGRL